MPRSRSRSNATSDAHADDGRIDINGRDRVQDLEVSGDRVDQDSNAGVLAGSPDISGDISLLAEDAQRSGPSNSSKKLGSKKKRANRVLDEELADSQRLLDLPDAGAAVSADAQDNHEPDPPDSSILPEFLDESGHAFDMSRFNIDSADGRAAALRYLGSDAVAQWSRVHNCGDQMRELMLGLLSNGVHQVVVDHKPSAPKPRKRIAPKPGSFASMGSDYRIGSSPTEPSILSQLAAEQKKRWAHVNQSLASKGANVVPETPMGCPTKVQSDMAELCHTVERVLACRQDLWSLPKDQRMRKATSMAMREIHKAEVDRIRKDNKPEDPSDSPTPSASPSTSPSGSQSSGGSSESVGTSCHSSLSGSADSIDRKDGFVASSPDSNSDKESGAQSKKRAKDRAGAMNSLGTPHKSSRAKAAAAGAPPNNPPNIPPGVMVFGDDDLKMWTYGTAKYKQGLNWEAYLHHKQAFDNHMQHKGKWSERTFKSIIHANLVPTVCAICGFLRSKWDSVADSKLILRLEKALRPSRSTDFAVELRALKLFDSKQSSDSLMARYSAFAEKFIYKCAEAEDAGKRIKPNVIKAAFKGEVEKESVLKHWLQEVQWKGVEHAHRRLLRKLREARSVEQLFHKPSNDRRRDTDRDRDDPPDENDNSRRRSFGQPKKGRGRVNNTKMQRRGRKGKSNFAEGGRDKRKPQPKGEDGPPVRSWKYDKRGPSWHTDTDLYECYDKPCNRKFCQRCRCHGHTAEYCRKSDDTHNLTREGYAQENAKGKAALRAPPPERTGKSNKARSRDRQESSDDERGWEDVDDEHQESRGSRNNHSHRSSKSSQCHDDDGDLHSHDGESEDRGGRSRNNGSSATNNRVRRRCV